MSNVVHLDDNEWMSRSEMADKLGVSERTVTRKAKRGELERRANPDGRGKLYRQPVDRETDTRQEKRHTRHDARHETGQDKRHQEDAESSGLGSTQDTRQDTRQDTTRDTRDSLRDTRDTDVSRLIDRLEAKNERIAELEEKKGELTAGLETAADYVADLEERLERERQRAERLRDRLRRVRDEREDARRERERAEFEIDSLAETIERLKKKEDRRRSLFRMGPLELLWHDG